MIDQLQTREGSRWTRNVSQPAERQIEILLVTVFNGSSSVRRSDANQTYGLLVSQVHSILRIDTGSTRLRRQATSGGWEVIYEGNWVPVFHLRQVLGLNAGAVDLAQAPGGTIRLLGLKAAEAAGRGPAYFGLAVDEVSEIVSYPLSQVQPFPRWVARRLPPAAIWGAVPASGGVPLLLLDGLALVAPYMQS